MKIKLQIGALLVVLIGIVIGAFFALRKPDVNRQELAVVFVGRNLESAQEKLYRTLLPNLVEEYNQQTLAAKLRVEIVQPDEKKPRKQIYAELAHRKDLLAVLDNSWGQEILQDKAGILEIAAPVIFLNADRNKTDFGEARLFLGSGDAVPEQMAQLLHSIVDRKANSNPGAKPAPEELQFAFLGEQEYRLTGLFKSAIDEAGFKYRAVSVEGTSEIPSRRALQKMKGDLLQIFPQPGSKARKVIVLNTHAAWGTEILRWIDQDFKSTTVVGFQSIKNKDHSVQMIEPTNELIMLSQSADSVPAAVFLKRREMLQKQDDMFKADDVVFYMRRAMAAMEMIARSLRNDAYDGAVSTSTLIEQASQFFRDCRDNEVETSLGLLKFGPDGEERGNNHIVLRRGQIVSSYPQQLNAKNKLVPHIQFGFRDVKMSNVDIRKQTFHSEFVLWVRCNNELIRQLPVPGAEDSVPDRLLKLLSVGDHQGELNTRLVSQHSFGLLAEYAFAIEGEFRLRDSVGWWYPFDQQRLAVKVSVTLPDTDVRVGSEQFSAASGAGNTAVDGWDLLDSIVTFDNELVKSTSFPSTSVEGTDRQQYNKVTLTMLVRRQLWGALSLIYLPLLFMTCVSLAVLFMRINKNEDAGGKSSAKSDVPMETLNMQSQTTMGLMNGVVMFLFTYASHVPRLETPIYSDLLIGTAMLVAISNFVFNVILSRNQGKPLLGFLSHNRYRFGALIFTVVAFGMWLIVGFWQ